MKRIAVEEHFTTDGLVTYLQSRPVTSPQARMDKFNRFPAMSLGRVDERLKAMDTTSIEMQVLSISAPAIEEFEVAEAITMARRINDELCGVVNRYPTRFAGLATIPFQDPEAAATELERAVKELGLKGTLVNSHVNGEYLDETKYWVVFETAEKLNVPVYVHPRAPSPNMIKPYLAYPALSRALWGFGAEAGLHGMRLILSGVFDKYPKLKIILGHMGEAIPFWLWRIDNQWEREKSHPGSKPLLKVPSQYFQENFYVTTSGMFWQPAMQLVHTTLGADRILFAVDYPYESGNVAVQFMDSISLNKVDKEKIYHLNAEKLFGL